MSQENFTVLLTVDQNLRYQQNLQQAGVAIVVIVAQSDPLSNLMPLMPSTCAALDTIVPGEVVEITI